MFIIYCYKPVAPTGLLKNIHTYLPTCRSYGAKDKPYLLLSSFPTRVPALLLPLRRLGGALVPPEFIPPLAGGGGGGYNFILLFSINSLIISGFFSNCPCTIAFGQIAPVGHACKHLPQEVQVIDSPQGVLKSEMILTLCPRFITSQL